VILIKPKVEKIHWRDFHRVQRCIDLGTEAMSDSIASDIKKLSIGINRSKEKVYVGC